MLCLKSWKMTASILQAFIYSHNFISTTCCQPQGTSSFWILDQGGASPLDPTVASSKTTLADSLYHACSNSSKLYYTFSITPVLFYNHICTIEEHFNIPFRSFLSTASDVWDKLPVHVSSSSTLPVFRRLAPFIPSCLPWIHYTDHQSRNVL